MLRSCIPGLVVMVLAACSSTSGRSVAEPAPSDRGRIVVRLTHAQSAEIARVVLEIVSDPVCVRSRRDTDAKPAQSDFVVLQPGILALPDTNSVVLEGTGEQLREMLELIDKLDVPAATDQEMSRRVFPVEISLSELLAQFVPAACSWVPQ